VTLSLSVTACTSTPIARATSTPHASPTPMPTIVVATPSPPKSNPALTNASTCAGSQLRIAYLAAGSGAAAGSFGIELAVWNSGRPCQLRGWPSLQLLKSDGSLLPTQEVRTTSTFGGSADPTNVILYRSCGGTMGCPPGIPPSAYISFAGDDVIQPCETAAGVRVLTPGSATSLDVDLRVAGSFPDGQPFCSGGKIEVLPVHPQEWPNT
jgi:hypothetical protein